MQALTWDITYQSSQDAQIKITPFGDIHLGARACQEQEFARQVEQVASEPNHYWIGMGDYCMPENTEILTRKGLVSERHPSDRPPLPSIRSRLTRVRPFKSPSEEVLCSWNKRFHSGCC